MAQRVSVGIIEARDYGINQWCMEVHCRHPEWHNIIISRFCEGEYAFCWNRRLIALVMTQFWYQFAVSFDETEDRL
ncbi:hypothetical protein L286_23205 [Sphingobium sp. HDIP04]|nr:hypothetical protein L286_23205 [Sphingobium sp. HDIP04]